MNHSDYFDFDEAVQYLKTTPSTLYKWLQAGKVPGHKLGRQWRFLKDELEIHISGQGARIHVQKDFLRLEEILSTRSKSKESEMNVQSQSLSEKLIWDAFDQGSMQIHIYPAKGKYEISYRGLDGLGTLADLQEESFNELDQALHKLSTPIDEDSSRRMYLHRDEDVLQVRYQKLETVAGPRLTLKLWQPEKNVFPLQRITSDKEALNHFNSWVKRTEGLFIVTGASGSGKTTTIFSLMNEHKNKGRLIFTLEESVEFIVEGLNQVEFKGGKQEQFTEIFEKVYSSDPDVICLGLGWTSGMEAKIFNAAYKAASTGHIVILQMNEASCEQAISTFKKFVPHEIDHLLAGVSCQKFLFEGDGAKAIYEFKSGTQIKN